MHRTLLTFLSISLLAAGASSCGKTSKGKLVNDWKVDSSESIIKSSGTSGSFVNQTIQTDGTGLTNSTETGDLLGTSSSYLSGTVNTDEFIIKKDGTWSKVTAYRYPESTTTSTYTTTTSGTWNFIDKSEKEDLKKNERVLFNVLQETKVVLQVMNSDGSTVGGGTQTNSYVTGEHPIIYTVKESKNKSLELYTEGKTVTEVLDVSQPENHTSSYSIRLTMSPK